VIYFNLFQDIELDWPPVVNCGQWWSCRVELQSRVHIKIKGWRKKWDTEGERL